MKSRVIAIIFILVLIGAGAFYLLGGRQQAAASAQEGRLTIDLPVQVTPVARQRLEARLVRTGNIQADNDVLVVSETMGRVLAVKAEVGDFLRAGAVIAKVDDELKLANFLAAEANYEKAKRDLARFETLADRNSATSAELEGIRLAFKAAEAQYLMARRQLQDAEIKTPIAGVVAARFVSVGSTVGPGTPIANVVDISKLKIVLGVAEKDAYALKPGDQVTILLDVYPGKPFPGKIKHIGAKADEAHNFPVEVALGNPKDAPLRAGLFARVEFTSMAEHDVLAIPRTALVGSIRDPQVFVIEGSLARLRRLTLGEEVGNLLEVRDGLREGEGLVTSGQNNLKDGASVTVVK